MPNEIMVRAMQKMMDFLDGGQLPNYYGTI